MEWPIIEGDNPVSEMYRTLDGFQSTVGHVKPGTKLGRPLSKAKYFLATDSEQVPRGKGEKFRRERSEIVPETTYPQGVRAGLSGDGVPFAK